MIEMGIESSLLHAVMTGRKTVEARLRTAKFVTLRKGDDISFREDEWQDGRLAVSRSGAARAVITETAFYDSFELMLQDIDYRCIMPEAASIADVMSCYEQFYNPEQILEHGVVAIRFTVKS